MTNTDSIMRRKIPNTHSTYKIMVIALLVGFITAYQTVQLKPDHAIFQKWLHSYEEDSANLTAYRPTSFDYPIGWGRAGMKFKEDGCFILYEIAPNDAMVQILGRWKSISKDQLEITFPNGEKETFIIKIKNLNPQKLTINTIKTNPKY
jgi:hypothetical protein